MGSFAKSASADLGQPKPKSLCRKSATAIVTAVVEAVLSFIEERLQAPQFRSRTLTEPNSGEASFRQVDRVQP